MLVRRLLTAAVLAASLMVISACQPGAELGDLMGPEAPVPAALVKEMKLKDMGLKSPILVRLYKEESQLEHGIHDGQCGSQVG